jgi:hypothetical protein
MMPKQLLQLFFFSALALGALSPVSAQAAPEIAAPVEHRRGTEQTFLTFPEWFLVHSPAEYAIFVKDHAPSEFPFFGHISQFWTSYNSVYNISKDDYPFNFGYHVMIMVIGASTTVEYALRSVYETLVGRLSELTQTHGMTPEDRYGAAVAQDYVDFIRVLPWYEYKFTDKLAGLWTETPLTGPDMLRKWERKYALTTEYGIKAAYGWLIKKATKASYDEPLLVTAVLVDKLPPGAEASLPDLKVLWREADGSVLVLIPRYEAFKLNAANLAKQGASFIEIAGNRSIILVSLLVPAAWQPQEQDGRILFTQPVLTRPGEKRVALVVPVAGLAAMLNHVAAQGDTLEHIYDY